MQLLDINRLNMVSKEQRQMALPDFGIIKLVHNKQYCTDNGIKGFLSSILRLIVDCTEIVDKDELDRSGNVETGRRSSSS